MKRLILALFLGVLLCSLALAMPGLVQWRAVWNPNTEPDLAGYRLYWRVPGDVFSDVRCKDVGLVTETSVMDLGLTEGTWEFALTAYDTSGNESDFSEVVSHPFDLTVPVAPAPPTFERIP